MDAIERHWYAHIERLDPSYARVAGKKKMAGTSQAHTLIGSRSLDGTEILIQPHKMALNSSQIRQGLRWVNNQGTISKSITSFSRVE